MHPKIHLDPKKSYPCTTAQRPYGNPSLSPHVVQPEQDDPKETDSSQMITFMPSLVPLGTTIILSKECGSSSNIVFSNKVADVKKIHFKQSKLLLIIWPVFCRTKSVLVVGVKCTNLQYHKPTNPVEPVNNRPPKSCPRSRRKRKPQTDTAHKKPTLSTQTVDPRTPNEHPGR